MNNILAEMEQRKEFNEVVRGVQASLVTAMGRMAAHTGKVITYDQVLMLENDNVVSDEAIRQRRTLQGAGIKPKTLESILPTYLTQYRPHGQYKQRDVR